MTSATFLVIAIPTLAVVISYLAARRRIEQIHILVNSRLSDALKEIAVLKKRLGITDDE